MLGLKSICLLYASIIIWRCDKKIEESPIEKLICTNTVEIPKEKLSPKITQLSIANLLGQGIINIIDDQGVSSLFK